MRGRVARRMRLRVVEPARVRGERASRLHLAKAHGSAEEIGRRLEELDQEWPAERALETAAATLALVGAGLTAFRGRRWAALAGLAAGALLRHALTQQSVTVELLGRMGMRTREEIMIERMALKAMRGDFRWVTPVGEGGERVDPDTAYVAARA
jgi:hypothetical protein